MADQVGPNVARCQSCYDSGHEDGFRAGLLRAAEIAKEYGCSNPECRSCVGNQIAIALTAEAEKSP